MRPIRNTDPSLYRIISIRTVEARLWMIPSNNLKKLVGGILARYQEIFEIEIYAYFFLTNHYHLLIRAPKGNVDEFCENVNREIARRMNWLLRREGRFWSRRYDDIPLGSEDDLLEAFLYVTTNATRHGLLDDSNDWPGLHSFSHALKEKDRYFSFIHYSAEDGMPRTTQHALKLSILPQFANLSKDERTKRLKTLLNERLELYKEQRRAQKLSFLGLRNLVAQTAGDLPGKVSRSKRPFVYTKCRETWLRMRELFRSRLAQYRDASFQYRQGLMEVIFPSHSFKPPLHRLPRLERFKPLAWLAQAVPA